MVKEFLKLIGEDNEQKLRDGVTEIILDQIREDFMQYTEYLVSPDEVIEFLSKCQEEAMANIKGEIVKKFENEFREKMKLIGADK